MNIKRKHIPILIFAFFGTISPYFLGLYLFDKDEFLRLELWNNILLSMAYSFPVIYMNLIMQRFNHILKNGEIKEYPSDIINICINSAHQQYVVLIVCLLFFMDDSLFYFSYYRNITWIFSFSGMIFKAGKITKKHWGEKKLSDIISSSSIKNTGEEKK